MKNKREDSKYIYCDNRKCPYLAECARWYKHAPLDEIVTVRRYELNKKGECDYKD